MTIDLRHSTDFEVLRAAKVLARVNVAAHESQVHYLVVGATARTLISIGLLGTPPERQTRDIDIAAEVDSWKDLEDLVDKFEKHNTPHKFIIEGTEVDVVPYGGIEQPDRTILFPNDCRMSVLGLREAVASAQKVLLPDGVSVDVPSIPALAFLKLFAWRDRHYDDRRDAVDLATMIGWYSSERYLDRVYDEEGALEVFDYDVELAGAWLLGSHMTDLLAGEDVVSLLRIIEDDDLMGRLVRDMDHVRASVLVPAMVKGIRDADGESRRQVFQ